MKATDLMIGDWVQIDELMFKIVDLDAPHGEVHSECWVYDLERCSPIEITPEILEKNGVEEVKHYYPYPTYEFRGIEQCVVRVAFPKDSNKTKYKKPFIEIDSEQCWIAHVDTEYVHELQHALRLCGIEKEIIL